MGIVWSFIHRDTHPLAAARLWGVFPGKMWWHRMESWGWARLGELFLLLALQKAQLV